jgi:hypothetical protein
MALSPTIAKSHDQKLVDDYLARAIEEFDTNRLATRLMRRLVQEFPGYFLQAAMPHLSAGRTSNALRHLAVLLLHQEGSLQMMTDPKLGSRENAVRLFNRFLEIDPSFDVLLARKLPDRHGSNWAEALDVAHSTRALDILDQTSYGRRLLPVLGHLVDHSNNLISAKATLFVGRRLQNPTWTARQLTQSDQRVRANAVEALWGVDSPAAAGILENCRSDHNNRVVGNSLLGLHFLGQGPRVEQRVLDMARAGKHETRLTAAWLLGRIDGQDCFDCLTRLLKDDHPQVRSRALWSLLEIRRAKDKSPEAIASRAAKQDTNAAARTIENVAAVLKGRPQEGFVEVVLDGSRFNTKSQHEHKK